MRRYIIKTGLALAAGLALGTLAPPRAGAQVNIPAPTTARREEALKKASNVRISASIYPFAIFQQSGYFSREGVGGTRTAHGRLTAVDVSFKIPRVYAPVEVGGWYWTRGSEFNLFEGTEYIYQLHARTFFKPDRTFGIQGSVLRGGYNIDNDFDDVVTSYTMFLLGEVSSALLMPQREFKHPWALQIGVGIYSNPTYDPTARRFNRGNYTRGFTSFVQGSVVLSEGLTLNVSQWYLRDRDLDYNRFLLGFGYSF